MTYLTSNKKEEIAAKYRGTMPNYSIRLLLDEIATAIATDGTGIDILPAAAGTAEAEKLVQLGASKDLDTLDLTELKLGGVAITADAGEINKLDGLATSKEELNLLTGLTATASQLNAVPSNAGKVALGIIRIASAVKDGETVTIGADVYEFDTDGSVTEGNILADCTGGSEVAAQGTLSMATKPTPGDTVTLGTTVYTFVPDGTANAAGEIDVGSDAAAAQANFVAAVNGTDGFNTAHPLVSAGDFAANDCVITALTPGTAGNSIASTETFTAVGNIFDAVTLGTTTAGVDPTAGEGSDALIAAINASATEAVKAIDISANEVLIVAEEAGVVTLALAETMGGANNAVDTSAMRGGGAASAVNIATVSRVPNATEVALDQMHIPLDFAPNFVFVQVRVTANGTIKAWDGGMTITSGDNPYITLTNAGNTDWAATDTVYVIAFS